MKNIIKTKFGFVGLRTECDDPDGEKEYVLIEKVEVKKAHRGKGHGRELMTLAIAEAKTTGLPVRLCAYETSKKIDLSRLVNFYESFGFSQDDEQGGDGIFMTMNY